MRARRGLLLSLLAGLGCSGPRSTPTPTASSLPAGITARAGAHLISATTVERVSAAQDVTPSVALGLAVSDALFAQAARERLPLGATRSIERAAAARSLLEQLTRDATQAGAPTPAELKELVQERWVDVDRPAAARTTHAVLLNRDPERDVAARAEAEKLALAVRGATTDEELVQLAQMFKPEGGFEIKAEALPFVTPDGRIFQRAEAGFKARPGAFDVDFARAANALQKPGELSPLVKSSFGYHVIRLDERLPSAIVAQQDLPELLGPAVAADRAGRSRRELLEKLRSSSPVQLDRAVEDLTGRVETPP